MNVELSVRDGADLMTRVSAEAAGPANFVVKRNWRTELDQMVRREGDRGHLDALFASSALQSRTVNHTVTQADSGTFFSHPAGSSGNPLEPEEIVTPITVTLSGSFEVGWYVGFSVSPRTVTIVSGATTIATLLTGEAAIILWTGTEFVVVTERTFPAPLTLIFTARQDNGKTALIVGTATTLYRYYGFDDAALVAADVVESGVLGSIATTNQWLTIGTDFSTENAHRWEAVNVGGVAVFNNGVELPQSYDLTEFAVRPIYELREQGIAFVGTITEIAGILICCDVAEIHADYLRAVMGVIGYGSFANGQSTHYDRVHYRVMWGDPIGVDRWGASVEAAIAEGTRTLVLAYDMSSFQPGDAIRVVGAGVEGGDLLTTLGYRSAASTWILTDEAGTSTLTGKVSKRDAASLIVGNYDLLDDASPILRAIKTQDRLLIAKNTGFVLGEYTGDRALPFVFTRVYSGSEGLFWRWTMTELAGEVIYAGQNDFYTFDLVSRQPKQHPRLTLCADIFFDAVDDAEQDEVFAINNGHTKEIWFMFPANADGDAVLAYDYRRRDLGGDRCSTLDAAYSIAGTVERPLATVAHGASEEWVLMGNAAGKLLQYGFDRTGPIAWTRQQVAYDSELWSGLGDFGDALNEKHLKQYLLLLASQSINAAITLGLWAVRNPGEALTELTGSPVAFTTPQTQNTVYLHHLAHLVQDRITVDSLYNVRLAKRVWGLGRVGSASAQRR